jgi:hypothetical protein
MHRLILRTPHASYRMFGLEFRDDADGSLYIETASAKQPDGSGGKKLRISYHATGRINYQGVANTISYGEPIFAISQAQPLLCLSLAEIDRLPKIEAPRPDDLVIDVAVAPQGRFSLYVTMTPPDAPPLEPNALVVTYEGWFAIQIITGPPPREDIAPGINRVLALKGLFDDQQLGQEQALIFFHQKRMGVKDLLVYWEAANNRFRLIFSVPMRIPPALEILFAEPNLEAVPLEPLVRNTATAELRFKVRGPGGFLSVPPNITKLALHAEL